MDTENRDFLTEVTNEVMALDPYFRAVVDSMDFFVQREDPSRVISMMRMLQAHTQMVRGLLLVTISSTVCPRPSARGGRHR